MKERRAYIRVPAGLELTYQTAQGIVTPRLGMSQDLSFGGMRFSQAERLETGHKVSLTLNLPKEGIVVLHGIVVWCRESVNGKGGFQTGMRWVDLNPVAQARLNSFLTERSRQRTIVSDRSQGTSEPAIVWSRAIVLGLFGFTLLAAGALFWLDRTALSIEVDALSAAVQSYEQQVAYLLSYIPH